MFLVIVKGCLGERRDGLVILMIQLHGGEVVYDFYVHARSIIAIHHGARRSDVQPVSIRTAKVGPGAFDPVSRRCACASKHPR